MSNRKINHEKGLLFYVIIVIISILLCKVGSAQGFTPNVLVNDNTTGEQNTEGKQIIAVLGDSVYVVWNDLRASDTTDIYFAKSEDGGATFGASVKVSSIPDTVQQIWPSLAVDNSGVIYIVWSMISIDFVSAAYGIWFAKSTDGGASFEPAIRVDTVGIFPAVAVYGNNVYVLYAEPSNYPFINFLFARSTDGGASFEPSYYINDVSAQDTAACEAMTALCVDAAGNIYAAWSDGRRINGNGDIYFAKSTDSGVSFGTNVPVNDTTGPAVDSIQYNPAIAVKGVDTVYVVWCDCRHGGNDNKAVYFARSTDGGTGFDTDVPVSDTIDETWCLGPGIATSTSGLIYVTYSANRAGTGDGIWCTVSQDNGTSFLNSIAVADTFDIDSKRPSITTGSDNEAYIVWSDQRTGNRDIYFAKGSVTGKIEKKDVVPVGFGFGGGSSNFFVTSVSLQYCLPTDGFIQLAVYDISGRLVRTLIKRKESAGVHTVLWNGRDDQGCPMSSGVYLFCLKSGDFQSVSKVVLLN